MDENSVHSIYHRFITIQICIFLHMKKIRVEPNWRFTDSEGRQLTPQLFDLLKALKRSGKLTDAAKTIDVSYRHGWNLIKEWTDFFGTPLVDMKKGKGASLTMLGEKLLWAEERVQARLGPQLENLASELNLEIHKTLQKEQPVINIFASHGYAVALLPEWVDKLQVNLQYMPAEHAISAVINGECELAGFHLPRNLEDSELYKRYKQLLSSSDLTVISFITRSQGLIIQSGNPKNISSLKNLTRQDIKFINRQQGSGTSELLEEWLLNEQIPTNKIKGYETREFTHSAVAAYVASGMADVGLGVEPPARNFGLDFIALGKEHYLFVCRTESLASQSLDSFIKEISNNAFAEAIIRLPGYNLDSPGKLISTTELFNSLTD